MGFFETVQSTINDFANNVNQYLGTEGPSQEATTQFATLVRHVKNQGDLKVGNSGYNVKLLQGALTQLGYGGYLQPYGIDGDYGGKTSTAVKAFQNANDLAATGRCDSVTITVLYQKIKEKAQKGQIIPELANLMVQKGMSEIYDEYPTTGGSEDTTPTITPETEEGMNWKPIMIGGAIIGLAILITKQ